MTEQRWQPGASLRVLQARAAMLAEVRAFFAERRVMEVETPLLCRHSGTDPQLSPFSVPTGEGGQAFLQTSPEFAMKRLLAAGTGPIYQICKAFRAGDQGRRHNPEFTLLEWYRPDFDEFMLMDEVTILVQQLLGRREVSRFSYRALFQRFLGLDPHAVSTEELQECVSAQVDLSFSGGDRDLWLDLAFSHLIEPQLQGLCFIHDYPASQAALAQIHQDELGVPVGRRFELLVDGMELANGYYELRDAGEQAARFQQDLALREHQGKPALSPDTRFLAALDAGLPACAGVALGLDRLLMCQLGLSDIDQAMAFSADRA